MGFEWVQIILGGKVLQEGEVAIKSHQISRFIDRRMEAVSVR